MIDNLANKKIIKSKRVCYTNIACTDYAYVVYDKNYERNIKTVKKYIESLGIILCGRFAEFEYLNMDACIKRSLDLS